MAKSKRKRNSKTKRARGGKGQAARRSGGSPRRDYAAASGAGGGSKTSGAKGGSDPVPDTESGSAQARGAKDSPAKAAGSGHEQSAPPAQAKAADQTESEPPSPPAAAAKPRDPGPPDEPKSPPPADLPEAVARDRASTEALATEPEQDPDAGARDAAPATSPSAAPGAGSAAGEPLLAGPESRRARWWSLLRRRRRREPGFPPRGAFLKGALIGATVGIPIFAALTYSLTLTGMRGFPVSFERVLFLVATFAGLPLVLTAGGVGRLAARAAIRASARRHAAGARAAGPALAVGGFGVLQIALIAVGGFPTTGWEWGITALFGTAGGVLLGVPIGAWVATGAPRQPGGVNAAPSA